MAEPRANQKVERAYVMARDDHRCYACGRMFHVKPEQLQLDHVVPVADGGPDHRGNYGLLCVRCHRAKTNAERRRSDRVARSTLIRVGQTVFGLALIGLAINWWRPWPWPTVAGWAAVCAPFALAGFVVDVYWRRRRAVRARLTVALQPLTHAPYKDRRVRCSQWSGWLYPSPRKLLVPFAVRFCDTSNPAVLAGICAEASRVTGRVFGLRRINLNAELLTLVDGAPTPNPEPEEVTPMPRLPTRLRRPLPDLADSPDQGVLPLGVDQAGGEIAWQPAVTSHALIVGRTNAGKTAALRCLIAGALERGWAVKIVDPKMLSFWAYRGMVAEVATTDKEMVALITTTANEMRLRYEELKRHPDRAARMVPALLVVDEVSEFIRATTALHRATSNRASGEHPVVDQWRALAALGREARVHLAVGTQRPDAKEYGGAARDNFAFRVACGPLSQDAARMMFGPGQGEVGRDVPAGVPGRATVDPGDGTGPRQVQVYWEPPVNG